MVKIKHIINGYYMGWSKFDMPIFGGSKEQAEEFKTKEEAITFIQNNCFGSGYLLLNCVVI
jgi:hypothetical protein